MISSSHNNKEIFGFLERFFCLFVFYHEELRDPYIQTVCYVLFPYVNTSNVICCIVCCFTKGGSVSPMYDNWYTSALSRILRQDLGTSCDSEGGWGVGGEGVWKKWDDVAGKGANNSGITYVISICMYLFLPAFRKCFRSSKLLMAKLPPKTIM